MEGNSMVQGVKHPICPMCSTPEVMYRSPLYPVNKPFWEPSKGFNMSDALRLPGAVRHPPPPEAKPGIPDALPQNPWIERWGGSRRGGVPHYLQEGWGPPPMRRGIFTN